MRLSKILPSLATVFLLGMAYHFNQDKARILSCNDGDTCVAEDQNGDLLNIRFYGIDAPEVGKKKVGKDSGQLFGRESHEFLAGKLSGQDVVLSRKGEDVYGRLLAEVYLDGELINESMVELGLAHAYRSWQDGPGSVANYEKLERQAQRERRGLWILEEVELPSEYRRRHPRKRIAKRVLGPRQ